MSQQKQGYTVGMFLDPHLDTAARIDGSDVVPDNPTFEKYIDMVAEELVKVCQQSFYVSVAGMIATFQTAHPPDFEALATHCLQAMNTAGKRFGPVKQL